MQEAECGYLHTEISYYFEKVKIMFCFAVLQHPVHGAESCIVEQANKLDILRVIFGIFPIVFILKLETTGSTFRA